jgi:hypothetical protein
MRRSLAILAVVLSIWAVSRASSAFAAEAKGHVETANPGFFAVRDGNRTPLDVGSEIYEFDILETDSTGSALIRFVDESTLELRSGSRLDVKDVVFSEGRNRFNVGLGQGIARIITGAIVKLNPRGFKLSTPKSSIGIRGTTLLVEVMEKYERVTVEDISEGSYVTCVDTVNEKSYSLTEIDDSVTISSEERIDPSTGAVSAITETTTQGAGVIEGIQGPSGSGGGSGSGASGRTGGGYGGRSGSSQGSEAGGEGPSGGSGSSGSGGGSGSSGGPDAECCNENSSPGQ